LDQASHKTTIKRQHKDRKGAPDFAALRYRVTFLARRDAGKDGLKPCATANGKIEPRYPLFGQFATQRRNYLELMFEWPYIGRCRLHRSGRQFKDFGHKETLAFFS